MRKLVLTALTVAGSVALLSETGIAQMTRTDSPEAEGRRICRYMDVTGKIAARRRVCMTKAEWDRAHEEQRRVGQEFVENLDSCQRRAETGGC